MRDAAPPLPRRLAAEGPGLARTLAWGYAALVVATSTLIVLGALVRAHGAGLACPDWPLCFGQLVPRMNLEVGFEWTHRLVAGGVSLAFVALAAVALRDARLRPRVAGWLAVSASLLAVQVALGALTVWKLLAAWTVTSHLVVGNSFNACLLLLALRMRDAALEDEGRAAQRAIAAAGPGVRAALFSVAALLALQIVLGGLVSSTFAGMACPEWPRCNGGVWFPALAGSVGLHLAHRWNAILLLAALGAAFLLGRREPGLARPTALALLLALAQTGVGVANVLLGIPVELTALHSALAAGLVLTQTAALRAAHQRGTAPGA